MRLNRFIKTLPSVNRTMPGFRRRSPSRASVVDDDRRPSPCELSAKSVPTRWMYQAERQESIRAPLQSGNPNGIVVESRVPLQSGNPNGIVVESPTVFVPVGSVRRLVDIPVCPSVSALILVICAGQNQPRAYIDDCHSVVSARTVGFRLS